MADCNKNGHIFGPAGKCLFCPADRPPTDFGACAICSSALLMVRVRELKGQIVAVCINCDVVRDPKPQKSRTPLADAVQKARGAPPTEPVRFGEPKSSS